VRLIQRHHAVEILAAPLQQLLQVVSPREQRVRDERDARVRRRCAWRLQVSRSARIGGVNRQTKKTRAEWRE
jgi:hypothetical protein